MRPDLFWSKVEKTPTCWLWRAGHFPNGYGACHVNRKVRGAHRWAWEITKGPVPEGMHVLHRCDVRTCVNPDHLWLGTHAENMADKVAKGRQARCGAKVPNAPKGEHNGRSKLKRDQVEHIRLIHSLGIVSGREIGRAFGVSSAQVQRVVRRVDWRHDVAA